MSITTREGDQSPLVVESVRERDMDFLLMEEFYAGTGFERLFLEVVERPSFSFVGAQRSIVNSHLGETDIHVECRDGNGSVLHLLIENKIDAVFQKDQHVRYMQRAQLLVGPSVSARVMLVAPRAYINSQNEFEYAISYEAIMAWFRARTDDIPRSLYKAEILRLAIEQERRGYQAVKDELVTAVWSQYYEYVQAHMPELAMERPGVKPSSSSFVYFHPKWLPDGTRLIHKMEKGYLDLELSGRAGEYEALAQRYSSVLSDGVSLVRTNKSVSFRVEVPALSFERNLDDQGDAMRAVVSGTERVRSLVGLL